jgi:integrase
VGVIQKRDRKNGSVTYRVIIRKSDKNEKAITKSFSKKTKASAWMAKTEADLERDLYREDQQLFGNIINRYIMEIGKIKSFGRSKSYSLIFLQDQLGHLKLKDLTSDALYNWALSRSKGCASSTVMMDMSYIGVVLSTAEEMWGCKPKFNEYKKAMSTLKKLSIITPSDERDRRISDEEFNEILAYSNTALPLEDWTYFSLSTSMRVGEVAELLWSDLSADGKSIIIRQRKHPKKKRDDKVPLLPAAQEIIKRQPVDLSSRKILIGKDKNKRWVSASELIFPQNPKSITSAFRRARQRSTVEDLRYHDIRHEAISRLFELGFDSMVVSVFSGHRDINMLRRYTHMNANKILSMLD